MKTLKEIQTEVFNTCDNFKCWKLAPCDSCREKQKTFNECITAFREMIDKWEYGEDNEKVVYSKDLLSEIPEVSK